MEDDWLYLDIAVLAVVLLVNAFFFGFETALLRLGSKEVERKALEEKDKKSARLLRIINAPYFYIDTLRLILCVVNIAAGALFVLRTDNPAVMVLSGILFVLVLMTFGIMLPERIASRIPEKWAYLFINPVHFILVLFYPLTGIVTLFLKSLFFVFGVRTNNDANDVTEEEIIDMVNEGHEQGLIQASEAEMISNIFELGDKEAQNIMTHRNNIVALEAALTLDEAIAAILDGNNSRYPVYEENIDHIVGILHMKDAMRFHMDENAKSVGIGSLEGLLREPYYVPQTKNIDELFKEMQKNKLQMVIVVDEYGQTAGLVAMEDILEEIVGNIQDEYDEEGEHIEKKGEDEYIIDGMTPLEELEEQFGIKFDTEDFETLNGYMISKLDRIPEENEEFEVECGGYNFKILKIENKMIKSVLVTAAVSEQEEEQQKIADSTLDEKKER